MKIINNNKKQFQEMNKKSVGSKWKSDMVKNMSNVFTEDKITQGDFQ